MAQGRVKWYSPNLGHGFILPDDEGVELLVVHEDIVGRGFKSLENNARVSYEAAAGREGPEAHNVSRV
jgi:CspA family cold shock protein